MSRTETRRDSSRASWKVRLAPPVLWAMMRSLGLGMGFVKFVNISTVGCAGASESGDFGVIWSGKGGRETVNGVGGRG